MMTQSSSMSGSATSAGSRASMDADRNPPPPSPEELKAQAEQLAALDMQGHLILKERGTDGDLKCILRGISEDMPKKVEAVQAAATPAERATALSDLSYLLNDNVEVITAPPQPEV